MSMFEFVLNGVSPAYFGENMIGKNSFGTACTSGSLYFEENGEVKHLLFDIGFGVWKNLARRENLPSNGQINYKAAKLAGIFISHWHIDHFGELVVFLESYRRTHGSEVCIPIYLSEKSFNQFEAIYPWILKPKHGFDQVEIHIVKDNQIVEISSEVNILAISADSHCWGGLNYLVAAGRKQIFVGWDMLEPPQESVDWGQVDLAFLEGNTFEDQLKTGHTSIRTMVNWANEVGLKNVSIVHYSGWEDGVVLFGKQRRQALQNLVKGNAYLKVKFGRVGDRFSWQS